MLKLSIHRLNLPLHDSNADWRYKSYVARSYHKRINLTNENYVGQLINIMGPPIPGRGVPRIDVFFAGNDFYNDNSKWVKLCLF